MAMVFRDAFDDYAHVGSALAASRGPDNRRPLVTIAIPTFKRPELLLQAIHSALAQECDVPYEVIVVDNDQDVAREVLGRLPQSPPQPLRYFINAENIGMFGNWNRCIEKARGEWLTILNDDDVLSPNYLGRMLRWVSDNPQIDGLVCKKIIDDRRRVTPAPQRRSKLWRAVARARFDRRGLARVTPRTLFFGNDVGSGLGFLFRRRDALQLGGYYPEDWPSADYFFYVRFCIKKHLFLARDALAHVGIGENESQRRDTLIAFIHKDHQLREALLGDHVPAWWRHLSPWLVANQIADTHDFWRVELDKGQLEATLHMRLPSPSRFRVTAARLALRAF